MKQIVTAAALSVAVALSSGAQAGERKIIRIATDNTDLVLEVSPNNRLYQTYFGPGLRHESDLQNLSWSQHAGSDGSVSKRGWEVYSTSGNEDFFEPALGITHADGNMTTYLYYVDSSQETVPGGIHTRINLRDDKYPVNVTVNYVAYTEENVIKTWTEITHQERKPVLMSQYASAMLYFNEPEYWLTEFSSDWAKEAGMSTQRLQFGKKVLDTKLGSRAAMH
ncbi:MAG: alpha-galactosidase, partial [Muribaculaceae bacterium]|nr:alpha-galactosidase [Muribaculaceae bacterium]